MPIALTRRRLAALASKLPPNPTTDFKPGVLLDDLDKAAPVYAREAAYHGADGSWWKVWREIQRARGLAATAAIAELKPEGLRWFACWAFKEGAAEEAIEAYRLHLAAPKHGPFPRENELYLDALLARGRLDEAVATVDHLANGGSDAPHEQAVLALGLVAAGRAADALARLKPIRVRYPDSAEVWVATAVALRAEGLAEEAQQAAQDAAKCGVYSDRFRGSMVPSVVSAAQWRAWEKMFSPESQPDRAWLASPGGELVPGPKRAPHSWGGKLWRTSRCHGCGHLIRVWFTLDLHAVPALGERLPGWRWFPLLGCADCMVWMGRHDYRIDPDRRVVKLENVAIDCEQFGTAYSTAPALPEKPVAIEWQEPTLGAAAESASPDSCGFGKALVGGVPLWTQGSMRLWCPGCRGEMVYIAAMTTAKEFKPSITINNLSGFQYHFACAKCRKLSVLAQWT